MLFKEAMSVWPQWRAEGGAGGATASGVTRVKGQPGQLTNKQPSRRSAERSWVGGGAAHRNPP